jgi:predicted DNA binding protein
MTVLATIAIAADDFDLGEVLTGNDSVVELTQFVPIDGDLVPYFWAENHDLDAFEENVRADSRVAELTHLDGAVDRRLYQVEWAEGIDGFLSALSEHDILVEHATGNDDEWVFRLRAHDREPLAGFQATCTDDGITLSVRAVHHNPDDPDQSAYGLTDDQQEALLVAQNNGYFDIPQEHSLTELADELSISRQSFSRRLKRGHNTLIANTLGTDHSL